MWLRCTLSLLYLLQLVVLSGMVAAYIYDNSFPRPPAQLAPTPSTQHPTKTLTRPKSKTFWKKPMMKPIPLRYLMDKMDTVTSPLDLARLFTDSSIDDHQLSRWMSRSVRSAPRVGTYGWRLKQEPHQHRGKRKIAPKSSYSVRDESKSRERRARGPDVVIADDGVVEDVDVEKTDENDEDYFSDYQGDDYTDNQLETFEAALYHKYEMATCSATSCKDPRPFVQHVSDPYNRHLIFIPDCTLLHRCMNSSGCCRDINRECAPKKMSIVDKSFFVVDLISSAGDLVSFNPGMTKTISFVNHTECECKEKPRHPRCTKRCPTPFRLTRDGVNCKCDCFRKAYEDSWQCEGVKAGVKSLAHDELVCIKNDSCYKPQCTEGEFDVKLGYCPLTDEYAMPIFLFENPEDRRYYRKHLYNFDFSKQIPTTAHPSTSTTPPKENESAKSDINFASSVTEQLHDSDEFPNVTTPHPTGATGFGESLNNSETKNENEITKFQNFSNSDSELVNNLINVTSSDNKDILESETFSSRDSEKRSFLTNNSSENAFEADTEGSALSQIADEFLNGSSHHQNVSDVPSYGQGQEERLFETETIFNSSELSYNATNMTVNHDSLTIDNGDATTVNDSLEEMVTSHSEPIDKVTSSDIKADDKVMHDAPKTHFRSGKSKSKNKVKVLKKLKRGGEEIVSKKHDLFSETISDSSLFSSLVSISAMDTLPPSSNPRRSKASSSSKGSKTVSADQSDPINSQNRPALDGLYDYDYSPLEGSGENFDDSFR